ncbi:MAG: diphthine--ammonia ligase [Candidatus Aenigmarchaeota archaeon]|nr:diphthine--ammonia ligase [Candidatus Aenigmarchaeota archaeon]
MKLVALFSGGKDSVFAIQKAQEMGHSVEKLATAISQKPESYIFYTPNVGLAFMQSRLLGMQLISKGSTGMDELESKDLKVLLTNLEVEGVVCGAVANKHQKKMIVDVCKELGLKALFPLWGKKPFDILKEMLEQKYEIMVTAAPKKGFTKTWLGKMIDKKAIASLKKKGIDISGESGKLETLVLDCPIFSRKLEITKTEKILEKNRLVYKIIDAKFVDKQIL